MITLPTMVTQTSKVSDADSAVASDNLLGTDALPQGFITELGNRLLTLAQQQGVNTQSTDLTAEVDEKGVTKASLSALLQALDKPEALNALLQPENTKATLKSADDKDKSEASSLSASDLQNVQALFAMLPVAVEARNSQSAVSASTDKTSADAETTLNGSLLSRTLQNAVKEEQEAQSDSAPHKKSSDVLSAVSRDVSTTTASSSAAAASTTASTSNGALSLDESFKQVLSTLSKPEERRDTQSDTVTALTSAPVSSSSTLTNSTATTSTTPSTPMLNAQLGSNEWQQALSQQIVMFSRNGQQNAELRLHPEDLGAIQINLTLDKDQAQLSMVSSHSQVRAALEAALPQLRSALAESGINLGQSNVSSDAFAQSQNYQGQQEGRRDGQHGSFTLSQDSENEITPIAVPAALQARATGNGAVDIFA
ncbi:flagellar hook-length control protein FliK [Pantoea sp. EABMAA-21]|uniref:Flagellar hook-length control protein FliK n=1 Tax=Candidatus Pantoea communis TaxID=2608354 RepID=A0ABX0RN39_9GAMM|nr:MULTISPECIES: flagellar hook-length control protein FliK [Pantoea]MDI9276236.1 flagellar hook-length control protein FliK [Pantoea sp. EABMAA-21]NIG18026.1 flagellar hook-length control protein FliK [Pantoea communis]